MIQSHYRMTPSIPHRTACSGHCSAPEESPVEPNAADEVKLTGQKAPSCCSDTQAVALEVAAGAVGGTAGAPLRLMLFGPPGSGKSTQGRTVAAEREIPMVDLGKLLRAEVESGSDLGKALEPYTSTGRLAPDELVFPVIEQRLDQPDVEDGFVLVGLPRNVEQIALADSLGIEGWTALKVDVSEEEVTRRLLARGRADDTPEVIAERLEVYRQETVPMLEEYDRRGILVTVDGNGSIDQTAENIRQALS